MTKYTIGVEKDTEMYYVANHAGVIIISNIYEYTECLDEFLGHLQKYNLAGVKVNFDESFKKQSERKLTDRVISLFNNRQPLKE